MKTDLSKIVYTAILPWQTAIWASLWAAREQARMSHALLFLGPEGVGQYQFALSLAQAMLCLAVDEQGTSCHECHGCHLFQARSHPDLVLIEPEKTGQKISVDQIRDTVTALQETTSQGGCRVIVIHPATAMNTNAANALLKSLEEPPAKTLFILIGHEGMRLPQTIVSRCQKVNFKKPAYDEALVWLKSQVATEKVDLRLLLKLADGAPLRALGLLEKDTLVFREDLYDGLHALSEGRSDPIKLAASWQGIDQICVVDLLLSWLTDLLRYKLTQDSKMLVNDDYHAEIARVSIGLLKNNLLAYVDHVQQTRGELLSSVNLNKQLSLEDLLIRWTEYASS